MTVAIYPGTFDPPTLGHLHVIKEAARLFDHVIVLVAVNPSKTPLLAVSERLELLQTLCAQMPQVRVSATEGMVVDFARDVSARILVRGIRGGDDADAETELAAMNAAMAPEVSTVLLPAPNRVRDVSSSGLKERVRRGESIRDLCPPEVERVVRRKLAPIEPPLLQGQPDG